MDEYLTWEPQEYDGVQELVLSPQRIWLPDIGVDNRLVFVCSAPLYHVSVSRYNVACLSFKRVDETCNRLSNLCTKCGYQ